MNKLYVLRYFQDNKSMVKIGVTEDINERMKPINTNNPNDVEVIYIEERNDAYKIERKLHNYFISNNKKGEWFENIELSEIRLKIIEYSII
jgi:hypothetical protein